MSKATLTMNLFLGVCTILCFQFFACKEISVNDDDLDRIEGIFGEGENDDSSESDQTTSYEDEDSESNADDIESEETTGDTTDPSGGLEYWESSHKGVNRTFIGTYEYKSTYDSCTAEFYGPGLELPSVLRGYAYGDMIDFETSLSQLVWNAVIYPDDTFDFQTRYLDQFGNPSVTLTCTCAIENYYWGQESIECSCDPSNYADTCTIQYDLM